jgi:hypothetical protein
MNLVKQSVSKKICKSRGKNVVNQGMNTRFALSVQSHWLCDMRKEKDN